MTPAQAEIAGQIEVAYRGYHVWTSDEDYWYASRMRRAATGPSPTVCGASPEELTTELACEQGLAARIHQAALAAV
jgi:hypothetical protein